MRQNLRDADEDNKRLLLALKFGGVPSINNLNAIYNFQVSVPDIFRFPFCPSGPGIIDNVLAPALIQSDTHFPRYLYKTRLYYF